LNISQNAIGIPHRDAKGVFASAWLDPEFRSFRQVDSSINNAIHVSRAAIMAFGINTGIGAVRYHNLSHALRQNLIRYQLRAFNFVRCAHVL